MTMQQNTVQFSRYVSRGEIGFSVFAHRNDKNGTVDYRYNNDVKEMDPLAQLNVPEEEFDRKFAAPVGRR